MDRTKNSDQVNLVKAWIELPGEKPSLEPQLADALERWIRADKWLRKHFIVSKVWEMMVSQYNYTDPDAWRDVYDAQCFFGDMRQQNRTYWAGLVLEKLGQSMTYAIADRKWGDMAKIAKEIREYIELTEEIDQIDPRDLLKPVPRRIAFQPEILNVTHDPKAREKVLALVREITGDDPIVSDHTESRPHNNLGPDVTHVPHSGSKSPNTQTAANTGDHLAVEIEMILRSSRSHRSVQTGVPLQRPRSPDG